MLKHCSLDVQVPQEVAKAAQHAQSMHLQHGYKRAVVLASAQYRA